MSSGESKRKREDGTGENEGEESCGRGVDAKWDYSAPDVPTSHWIDRGFDGNYIGGMTRFLREIKDCTCQLRSGTCRENIYLGSGFGANDFVGANDSVLLHDDALLPHWEEFANALQLYRNPEASHNCAINNIQLTPSIISLLTPALKCKPISFFGLGNNVFG